MTIHDMIMDPGVRQPLTTRAARVLTSALVAMMAAPALHAGARDMATARIPHISSQQVMQDFGCWCNEYICSCRPD